MPFGMYNVVELDPKVTSNFVVLARLRALALTLEQQELQIAALKGPSRAVTA